MAPFDTARRYPIPSRRRGTAVAAVPAYLFQDLSRDWRRWTVAERLAAAALLAMPALVLAASLHLSV